MRSSRAHRKAASVLPEPVGAMTSAFSPAEIVCHAPTCAAVGRAKTSRNHVAVAGENTSNGSTGTLSILLSRTDSLTRQAYVTVGYQLRTAHRRTVNNPRCVGRSRCTWRGCHLQRERATYSSWPCVREKHSHGSQAVSPIADGFSSRPSKRPRWRLELARFSSRPSKRLRWRLELARFSSRPSKRPRWTPELARFSSQP